jgi:hypothetical protein
MLAGKAKPPAAVAGATVDDGAEVDAGAPNTNPVLEAGAVDEGAPPNAKPVEAGAMMALLLLPKGFDDCAAADALGEGSADDDAAGAAAAGPPNTNELALDEAGKLLPKGFALEEAGAAAAAVVEAVVDERPKDAGTVAAAEVDAAAVADDAADDDAAVPPPKENPPAKGLAMGGTEKMSFDAAEAEEDEGAAKGLTNVLEDEAAAGFASSSSLSAAPPAAAPPFNSSWQSVWSTSSMPMPHTGQSPSGSGAFGLAGGLAATSAAGFCGDFDDEVAAAGVLVDAAGPPKEKPATFVLLAPVVLELELALVLEDAAPLLLLVLGPPKLKGDDEAGKAKPPSDEDDEAAAVEDGAVVEAGVPNANGLENVAPAPNGLGAGFSSSSSTAAAAPFSSS